MSNGDPRQRLAEVEAALAGQAALRMVLAADQAEKAISGLLAEREALLARLGPVAIAQGAGAVAAASGGVAAGRDVHLHQTVAAPAARDEEAAVRYLSWVMAQTGFLSLSGIDPAVAGSQDRDARLSLPAVYTALRTLTLRLVKGGRSLDIAPKAPLSALEMLDRCPRLVLLGDPGSGKSTFVSFVALCLAGERLGQEGAGVQLLTAPLPEEEGTAEKGNATQPWTHGPLLPVRIVLRDFAAGGLPESGERGMAKHVWGFLQGRLEDEGLADAFPFVRDELCAGRGLVLFDGLDEVPEAEGRRDQIVEALGGFEASLGRSRVLVTSRPYAYQNQGWRLKGFAESTLAPFSRAQIARFVGLWHEELVTQGRIAKDAAAGQAELLRRDIFGSDRLLGLAERPLLLTLMASLHAWRGGSLPERREELYADAVELLLNTWENQRRVFLKGEPVLVQTSLAAWLKVDREKVRQVLEELAFGVHREQADAAGTADLTAGNLIESLLSVSRNPDANAVELLAYLRDRAGLLVERGARVYAFPHRTFQEYLAACHLARRSFPREVARLGRQDPGRWREVVLLTGAKVRRGAESSVWTLAEALCPRPVEGASGAADEWGALLAGQVLAESADLGEVEPQDEPKLARIRDWQVRLLRTDSFPVKERAAAGESLAVLGDPRFDPEHWGLPKEPDLGFVEVPAGPFLMGSDPKADREAQERESPQHSLSLSRYWLSRYPVTVGQYRRFVEWSGHAPEDPESLAGASNLPVVSVTWYEALAYCGWLGDRLAEEARNPAREGDLWSELRRGGLRVTLPSEAEWEKAARDGDGRIYPWEGKADANRANYADTGLGGRSAVGCFPGGMSSYGCEELSGNVWEWTRSLWGEDWKKPCFAYPYVSDDGREVIEASSEVLRVLRGGAFSFNSGYVRCAYRYGFSPGFRVDGIGFRVVLSPFPL